MEIATTVLTKASLGLYDYTAGTKPKSIIRTSHSMDLAVVRGEVAWTEYGKLADPLLKVAFRGGEIAAETGNRPFWMVLGKEKQAEGCKLVEGDIIRLGRSVFRVKQLNTRSQSRTIYPDLSPSPSIVLQDASLDLESQLCRVCLQGLHSASNPLLSPCQCSGSLQFIHLSCLRAFIQSRLEIRPNGFACGYFWQKLECEICQVPFSSTISTGEEMFDLLNIAVPTGPYLVLEDLRTAGLMAKGVHVVEMREDRGCRLGRAQTCEIVISDISAARFHACIRLSKGAFFLEDLHSKFGTSILTRSRLLLKVGSTATIQTDTALVVLRTVRPFRLKSLLCCLCRRSRSRREGNSAKAEELRHLETNGGKCELQLADIEAGKGALGDPGTTLRSDQA